MLDTDSWTDLAGETLPVERGRLDLFVLQRGQRGDDIEDVGWANVVRLEVPRGLQPGWTLVALANAGLLDPYDGVLHIGSPAGFPLLAPTVARRVARAVRVDPGTGVVAGAVRPAGASRLERRRVAKFLSRLELARPGERWEAPKGPDFWARAFLIQGLRALNLDLTALLSSPPSEVFSDLLGALAREAGCRVESSDETTDAAMPPREPRARVIPFYLPQFHPTSENDRWWGNGFTEWTNVTSATPVYEGHWQPRLPRDLGFYDLRLDQVRSAQADLAQRHAIAGFLYYHYWFSGRRILEAPLDALLAGDLDFPFAIMWANENWTRTWDGGESSVLLQQDYDDGSTAHFIDDALPYLHDPRYMQVDGKALLAIYRAALLPNLESVLADWRRRAAAESIELFILAVDLPEAFGGLAGDPAAHGIDGVMGFPPHRYHRSLPALEGRRLHPRFEGELWSYPALVAADEARLARGLSSDEYPTVLTGFDTTPRRQWRSMVFTGANPYTFRRWLVRAVGAVAQRPPERRIVFVNAWNEWAEGAVLEPDNRFGKTFLQAVRDAAGGSFTHPSRQEGFR